MKLIEIVFLQSWILCTSITELFFKWMMCSSCLLHFTNESRSTHFPEWAIFDLLGFRRLRYRKKNSFYLLIFYRNLLCGHWSGFFRFQYLLPPLLSHRLMHCRFYLQLDVQSLTFHGNRNILFFFFMSIRGKKNVSSTGVATSQGRIISVLSTTTLKKLGNIWIDLSCTNARKPTTNTAGLLLPVSFPLAPSPGISSPLLPSLSSGPHFSMFLLSSTTPLVLLFPPFPFCRLASLPAPVAVRRERSDVINRREVGKWLNRWSAVARCCTQPQTIYCSRDRFPLLFSLCPPPHPTPTFGRTSN